MFQFLGEFYSSSYLIVWLLLVKICLQLKIILHTPNRIKTAMMICRVHLLLTKFSALNSLVRTSKTVGKHTLATINSKNNSQKWDLFSALCIERPPSVAPTLNPLELAVKDAIEQYEVAKSLKSDHEIRKIRDRERTERLASGQKLAEEDIQESSLQTAEDFEEKSNRELAKFMEFLNDNPETVVTDKQSTKRCLDKHLILLCHQKVGQNFTWRLPEQIVDSNDNLRNTADRCLDLFGESGLQVKILGNCPFSVLKYKYPKPVSEQLKSIGKKIFYFKAQLIDGNLDAKQLNPHLIKNFLWLNRQECKELLKDKYWQSINSGLLIEGPRKTTLDSVLSKVQHKKYLNQNAASN